MQLIIVESPTKARTLKKYLGSAYLVESSVGHIRDLPKSTLGVDLDNNFEPVYETVKGKVKVVTGLKKLAKQAKTVYLAMDPDREGEAIAWHVAEMLGYGNKSKTSKMRDPSTASIRTGARRAQDEKAGLKSLPASSNKYRRVTFHEITKTAIEKALNSPGEINMALVDAQQARRVLDRLVGYKLSPVLWKKIRRGLSAGRVQSVALRMIVERELEIDQYKPQAYWEIGADLYPEVKTDLLRATLTLINGKKILVVDPKQKAPSKKEMEESIQIDSKMKADEIVKDLEGANYRVVGVTRKEQKRYPKPPFTTSTLQQVAASRMGWSGKQTMRVAQQLYEAGWITYHRTDSTNLAREAVEGVRAYILKEYGAKYIPDKPIFYKTSSKSAQEAHEAIRPTEIKSNVKFSNNNGIDERGKKLYALIRQRFMACQMTPAVYDQTSVEVRAVVGGGMGSTGGTGSTRSTERAEKVYGLRATGSIVKFAGWMKLAQLSTINKQQTAKNTRDDDVTLPDLVEGQALKLDKVVSEGKETQAPPRFNDASLVKELEKRGIGRPSTYASIISVLDERGYVERTDKRFYPTAVGRTVVEFLKKYFEVIMDYDFTAGMEADLDRVALGEKDWRGVMRDFWDPFLAKLGEVEDKAERMSVPVEKTGKKCPKCDDGEVVIRTGRFGRFYSCSNFGDKEKGCDYAENIVVKVEGVVCPLCRKGDVVSKNTRWGKPFFGCSLYPDCNWASWKQPQPGETLTMEEWKVMQEKREARKKVWAERMAKRKKK